MFAFSLVTRSTNHRRSIGTAIRNVCIVVPSHGRGLPAEVTLVPLRIVTDSESGLLREMLTLICGGGSLVDFTFQLPAKLGMRLRLEHPLEDIIEPGIIQTAAIIQRMESRSPDPRI